MAEALHIGLQKVQIVTWRDMEDPDAGGSELHAHRIASIWAREGIEVTLRTGASSGLSDNTVRNGYKVIRRGGRMSIFPRTALNSLLSRGDPPDGLMEVWHGMPFFSPLWATCPRIAFVHHVHDEVWDDLLPGPLAKVGRFMEMKVAPRIYGRTRLVTPSESARDDLVNMLGMSPSMVSVVHNGVDGRFSPGGERSVDPLVVAVGRLTAIKRFDALIDSLVEVRRQIPRLRAKIIGEGPERPRLEAKIREFDASDWVDLAGFVSDDELLDSYRNAWVVACASSREGWNMSITEGAACGTPAVATDVVGHRDSVWQGVSGLLAAPGPSFTSALLDVIRDPDLRERLGRGALDRSGVLTWEATAAGTLAALVEAARARLRHGA